MPQKYSTPVYTREVPSWVYDALIALGIVVSIVGIFRFSWVFMLPLAILVWGSFIEPRRLTTKRITIGSGNHSIRMLFLSDFHVGPYKGTRWITKLVREANALAPDLILLGGDFIYDAKSDPAPLAGLGGLRAPLGVVGIMGNHDFHYLPMATEAVLKKAGVVLLRNASFRFEKDGVSYAVVGVEDDWDADTDFDVAMRGVVKGDHLIMLVHNPDLAPHAALYRPALVLSGHVHGGQIRLPVFGPVPPLPHHLGKAYDRGLFMLRRAPLILGQGVGESGPRARLWCPPEMLEVTLRI